LKKSSFKDVPFAGKGAETVGTLQTDGGCDPLLRLSLSGGFGGCAAVPLAAVALLRRRLFHAPMTNSLNSHGRIADQRHGLVDAASDRWNCEHDRKPAVFYALLHGLAGSNRSLFVTSWQDKLIGDQRRLSLRGQLA
jgi:hypothetical protein